MDTTLPGETAQVTRWTPSRKAEVLARIRSGRLTPAQAEARYGISAEELHQWERLEATHGQRGLRTTKIQEIGRG